MSGVALSRPQVVEVEDAAARAEWDDKQKLEEDPRITRFGHFLRRTSLDEMPVGAYLVESVFDAPTNSQMQPEDHIPEEALDWQFTLSSGPGGQNVNKSATAIHLRFNIVRSSLPASYKEMLLAHRDRRVPLREHAPP